MTSENVDPDPNSKFLGFEIFYKFFSDAGASSASEGYSTIDQLQTNGFKRASYYKSDALSEHDTITDQDYPLVKIPIPNKGVQSLFRIDFQPLFNTPPEEPFIVAEPDVMNSQYTIPYLEGSVTKYKLIIRRGVDDTPKNPGAFMKPFTRAASTDADLTSLPINSPLILVLYAVSYGKYQLSSTLYSTTKCLLSISITLPLEV